MNASDPLSAAPSTPFDGCLLASFAAELPGLSVDWQPKPAPAPQSLFLNEPLAAALGLEARALASPAGLAVLSGQQVPAGARPVAQAYSGHQFGGFSPQLGDGRALLLGELIDPTGRRFDIAFKGSGRTPFSRSGDGKAAVGPMLREVLISEAMHHLGIATTRALAVVATGEPVMREQRLPGALLTRVAASHLRVGSFQFLASRGDEEGIARLLRYAVARHDPKLAELESREGLAALALAFVAGVGQRQAQLIAQWMHVGFVHGVMNTDNMTISGETIDYGPCAFLDAHDPSTVFSSIDHHGRYAYGQQPSIAQWNLARLAETLLPLMIPTWGEASSVERATQAVHAFQSAYQAAWLTLVRRKLGLADLPPADGDQALADRWLALLHLHQVDHTLAWWHLADAAVGHEQPLQQLFKGASELSSWLQAWREHLAPSTQAPEHRRSAMRQVSPGIVARNLQVEDALTAASQRGDLAPFKQLLAMLVRPFDPSAEAMDFLKPPDLVRSRHHRTFCGT